LSVVTAERGDYDVDGSCFFAAPNRSFRKNTQMRSILRLWFGISQPVGPAAYAASGFGLMLVKYSAEALVIWVYTSFFFPPWDFLNPMLQMRARTLQAGPEWLGWLVVVWSLPFLWIAISMSIRRAADAGLSPWLGLAVLIPVFNLLFMLAMCLIPSRPGQPWSVRGEPASGEGAAKDAVLAVAASMVVGAVMLLASVYLLGSYGASLFVGTPLVMGAVAAFLYNRRHPRTYAGSMAVGLAAVLCACLAMLLFALEGVICVAMAIPLMLPLGVLGGVTGKAIADSTRRPAGGLWAIIVVLPLLAGLESQWNRPAEHVVVTAVEIDASPEVVWENVLDFPELPEPTEWYFRSGIACPQRAQIIGRGVGATRHCIFTTGTFVEPITVWDAPHRLAFDVADQPAPMFELSPYRHVHPPHLDGYLRSKRGEFRLVRLSAGRTRLEGRTWYECDMYPQAYWTLWSHALIHRIHQRVLLHVKRLAEASAASSKAAAGQLGLFANRSGIRQNSVVVAALPRNSGEFRYNKWCVFTACLCTGAGGGSRLPATAGSSWSRTTARRAGPSDRARGRAGPNCRPGAPA
jgi:uncharacterized membrane protein YhaH (DUF805 family)